MAKGVVQVPEGRRIFARLTVTENLKMGAFVVDGQGGRRASGIERAFALFPRLKERAEPGRRHASGGEQQMLAMSRGADVGPQGPAPRRAVDGPGAAPGGPDLRHDQRAARARARRSCSSSRTPARRSQIADRGYVIETGQIVLARPRPRTCATTRWCRRPTSASTDGARSWQRSRGRSAAGRLQHDVVGGPDA